MREFTYNWLHITTKTQGTSVFRGVSEHDLIVFLNRCNSQNPGLWLYWY
jgi:hypothetical protein